MIFVVVAVVVIVVVVVVVHFNLISFPSQAFQPYLKLFLVPLVEIASSPRGYAQIRAEAEKGVVLLMAEKR